VVQKKGENEYYLTDVASYRYPKRDNWKKDEEK